MANNFVYFMWDNDTGQIKIGQSKNPESRLRDIRAERPNTELLTYLPDHSLERELHIRFSGLRMDGEWFKPSSELLQYILREQARPSYDYDPSDWLDNLRAQSGRLLLFGGLAVMGIGGCVGLPILALVFDGQPEARTMVGNWMLVGWLALAGITFLGLFLTGPELAQAEQPD